MAQFVAVLIVVAFALVSAVGAVSLVPNAVIPTTLLENSTDNTLVMKLKGIVTYYETDSQQEVTASYFATTNWSYPPGSVLTYSTNDGTLGSGDSALFFNELITIDYSSGTVKDRLEVGMGGTSPVPYYYAYSIDCADSWTDLGTSVETDCTDPVQWLTIDCNGGRRTANGDISIKVGICEQSLYMYSLLYTDPNSYYWKADLYASY